MDKVNINHLNNKNQCFSNDITITKKIRVDIYYHNSKYKKNKNNKKIFKFDPLNLILNFLNNKYKNINP